MVLTVLFLVEESFPNHIMLFVPEGIQVPASTQPVFTVESTWLTTPLWLNQSTAVPIDTLTWRGVGWGGGEEEGVSPPKSFYEGHLDKSPQGVWEGCKYKWQLAPPLPLRVPSPMSSSLFFFSLQRKEIPLRAMAQVLLLRKDSLFFLGGVCHNSWWIHFFFFFFFKTRPIYSIRCIQNIHGKHVLSLVLVITVFLSEYLNSNSDPCSTISKILWISHLSQSLQT